MGMWTRAEIDQMFAEEAQARVDTASVTRVPFQDRRRARYRGKVKRNAKIVALYEAGVSTTELGRRYGVSRNWITKIVQRELRRMAPPGCASHEQVKRNAEIRRLWEAGMTCRELASMFGVTFQRIQQIVRAPL
jgi:Mor family transcriptional regulator